MGYKIWRKDNSGWALAFDTIYQTRELADEGIAELNAVYHYQVSTGELSFYPYLEDIRLAKDGSIIDKVLSRKTKNVRKPKYRVKYKKH